MARPLRPSRRQQPHPGSPRPFRHKVLAIQVLETPPADHASAAAAPLGHKICCVERLSGHTHTLTSGPMLWVAGRQCATEALRMGFSGCTGRPRNRRAAERAQHAPWRRE